MNAEVGQEFQTTRKRRVRYVTAGVRNAKQVNLIYRMEQSFVNGVWYGSLLPLLMHMEHEGIGCYLEEQGDDGEWRQVGPLIQSRN